MLGLSCVPHRVYDVLYPFKPHFRCAQGRHFLLFCWLLTMLIVDSGKGTLKGLSRCVPPHIKYWALMRMVRSGWWSEQALVAEMSTQVLQHLPPPADGTLHLIGDATLKGKRGQKHPLGRKCRLNEYARFCFGFETVLLIASWGSFRVPLAVAVVDPQRKGHANILLRRMIRQFTPPAWARRIIVEADAGFAATKTFQLLKRKGYGYVFAVARTRKFSDGRHLRDLVQHLPKAQYRRIKTTKPDGRRRDYWVYACRKSLHGIGDVTIVLSKKRRNDGPKQTKIIVTNLDGATTADILSHYARRWGIEVTFKELKSGLHLGRMQVTKEKGRVARSVALPVLSYLLLLRLYGKEEPQCSLFKLKHRFAVDVYKEQAARTEYRWRAKLDNYRLAA